MVEAQTTSSISDWNLADKLGAGAFGTAYLGLNTTSNSQAAVKVFNDLEQESEDSFTTEI
jgi:hypothetical protein